MVKVFVISLFIFICSLSLADEDSILKVAQLDFNKSISRLSELETVCENNEIILKKYFFSGISASNDEMKKALFYFNHKASIACSEEAIKEYLIASAILYSLDESKQEAIHHANNLIITKHAKLLDLEHSYNTLPLELRNKFEQINELNSPFNLIKSFENMNNMN